MLRDPAKVDSSASNFELHLALLKNWFGDVKSSLIKYSEVMERHTHLYIGKELKVRRPAVPRENF